MQNEVAPLRLQQSSLAMTKKGVQDTSNSRRPPVTEAKNAASGWGSIFRLGGVAALVIILVSLLDIIITFFPWGATPDPGKGSVKSSG